MIKRILIKNSPTFSQIELHLQSGLNAISGVSGSGKSVFLHSILSAFGLKDSNAELIEVNLQIDSEQLGGYLEELGITLDANEDELNISILKKQNTRYFINNQSISKKKLSDFAKHFVKHISIKDGNELESDYMIEVLDLMLTQHDKQFTNLLQEYKQTFQDFKDCKHALQEIEQTQKNIESLRDFAQFEIDKIMRVNPQPGEYEKLLNDKKMLSKREKILQVCNDALQSLDTLNSIEKAYELLDMDITNFHTSLMEVRGNLENALDDFENLESDPESLLERISQLSDLNRRYGNEAAALQHLQQQQEKLKEYENIAFDKTQLEKKYTVLEQKLFELAHFLSQKRKVCIANFEAHLNTFAKQLKLQDITIQHSNIEPCRGGIDRLEIFLDHKKHSVISSGEYNRMRLAMLCVIAESSNKEFKQANNKIKQKFQEKGILILDEIDANLSGEESEGVAKLLKLLATNYQIFTISHQPFLPLACNHHYLIHKEENKKSTIKLLKKQEKIKEIARMISGSNLNQDALSYAEKLLNKNQS